MESFQLMSEAGNYLPGHVKPWTYWLQGILLMAPLFFVRHHVAPRLLLASQLLNGFVAYLVFVWEGGQVTKLFGIGHIFWVWPAYYLLRDCKSENLSLPYRSFACAALLTITTSLILDLRDVTLWLAGDRGSVLENVPLDHPLYRD